MRFRIPFALLGVLPTTLTVAFPAASAEELRDIIVSRSSIERAAAAPSEYFTGTVRLDSLLRTGPADTSIAYVIFAPGLRTAWHTHPLGQTLVVTSGSGLIQRWNGTMQRMRPGDVVWIPPQVKHWHGAPPGSAMTHVALTSAVEGKNVDWLEKVTEEQDMTMNHAVSVVRTRKDISESAPTLDRYTQQTLSEVWQRPGLSVRDRSFATLAVLIARNQMTELPTYLDRALDSDVKAGEISEVITHLAFYAGWGSAMPAATVAAEVFRARGIGVDQLPSAHTALLPINEADEMRRAKFVDENVGPVSPGVVQYTGDPLFHDVWLRPALAPRDRSLVTISALIGTGQFAQLPAHLNRAMDNGLTQVEVSELLTHLLFYAGWPNVFTAVPIVRDVLSNRQAQQ